MKECELRCIVGQFDFVRQPLNILSHNFFNALLLLSVDNYFGFVDLFIICNVVESYIGDQYTGARFHVYAFLLITVYLLKYVENIFNNVFLYILYVFQYIHLISILTDS